ncbi:hypothetical protein GDO81_001078 [Engystomops pustulosus]|uniref:Uncharacterized protein n=1 Tax=Engystomops pustulosus TaxID=76066 RepID=A0AAV7DBF4_ENGPU|nr:hypothetical protein GDO81_001078 [Engystomops pustulosus]
MKSVPNSNLSLPLSVNKEPSKCQSVSECKDIDINVPCAQQRFPDVREGKNSQKVFFKYDIPSVIESMNKATALVHHRKDTLKKIFNDILDGRRYRHGLGIG